MATIKKGDGSILGPNGVAVSGHETGSGIIQLNAAARTIVDQPSLPAIDLKGLKDVNTHLATARTHGNAWLNTYSGDAWNRLQGLISFSEVFTNMYKPLYAAAQGMGNQSSFNPDQISKLTGSLTALQSLVKAQHTQSQSTYEEIVGYRKNVSSDQSVFSTDYQTALQELGGTKGAIAQLEKKISSDSDAMNKDLAMIGGGATMMVVGGLMIAVGVLAEIETAGASTALVIGGLAVVAGGAAVTGIGAKNYDDMMKEMAADQKQLAKDKQELSAITNLKKQITGISGTLGSAESALGNLVTSWQQMDNAIGAVVSDLQAPETYLANLKRTNPNATPATVSLIVSAELQTANQDWLRSKTMAESLLGKGRNVRYLKTKGLPTQQAIAAASQAA